VRPTRIALGSTWRVRRRRILRLAFGLAAAVAWLFGGGRIAYAFPPDDSGAPTQLGLPPGSMVWRPWRLFDPYLSRREYVVSGGYASERPLGTKATLAGFEGSFGQTMESRAGPLFARLERDWGLRWTGGGHCVFLLPRFSYAAGALFGPFELTAQAATTLLQVHAGSGGLGAGLFSPRASAGAAARFGRVRLGVATFSEYAWRWLGAPSAIVEGILFEASFTDVSHPLPRFYRVEK
jgi:hypothetical protein